MTLEERIKRIEQALFGYSHDEEAGRAFFVEYEQALKELLKGNREPLRELKDKYGDITQKRRLSHDTRSNAV